LRYSRDGLNVLHYWGRFSVSGRARRWGSCGHRFPALASSRSSSSCPVSKHQFQLKRRKRRKNQTKRLVNTMKFKFETGSNQIKLIYKNKSENKKTTKKSEIRRSGFTFALPAPIFVVDGLMPS